MGIAKLTKTEYDGRLALYYACPGCNDNHRIPVSPANEYVWGWNGSMETPTFTPSVLVKFGHYVDNTPVDKCGICQSYKEKGRATKCYVCHSFVKGGFIEFLGDCTHDLAGKTVEMFPAPVIN